MTTILEKTAGLVAFVRTVETGSVASASRLIGSSPSAVSKSVARLEDRLGAKLIQRSTRSLSLTAEGAAYYERVSSVLQIIEDAEDAVQVAETARGLLRISLPVFLGREIIMPLARSFMAKHPDVRLELSLTDRHVDLIREGYDLAVRMGALQDSNLVGRKLADMRIACAASPDYIAERGAPQSIEDLRRHACLRYVLAGRAYPWSFAGDRTILLDGPLEADDGVALRAFAIEGGGITQLPYFALARYVTDGRLTTLLNASEPPPMPVHLLHAFGRQIPVRARLFSDHLTEHFAKSSPGAM